MLAKKVFRKGSEVMLLTVKTVAGPESDRPAFLFQPSRVLTKKGEHELGGALTPGEDVLLGAVLLLGCIFRLPSPDLAFLFAVQQRINQRARCPQAGIIQEQVGWGVMGGTGKWGRSKGVG